MSNTPCTDPTLTVNTCQYNGTLMLCLLEIAFNPNQNTLPRFFNTNIYVYNTIDEQNLAAQIYAGSLKYNADEIRCVSPFYMFNYWRK